MYYSRPMLGKSTWRPKRLRMEPLKRNNMIHQKKRNSSKVNLTISFIVHAALIAGLVFFAAKEGLLGKKLKQLTVTMVPKEKKPEPPKEKPPEPKAEPPKPSEGP